MLWQCVMRAICLTSMCSLTCFFHLWLAPLHNGMNRSEHIRDEFGDIHVEKSEGPSFYLDEHKLAVVASRVPALYADFRGQLERTIQIARDLDTLGPAGAAGSAAATGATATDAVNAWIVDGKSHTELLQQTRAVLLLNPDLYSAWNIR